MVRLTWGDWIRLSILAAWALSWTPIPNAAVSELFEAPWEAFGAMATAAATLVALWFGLTDARRRRDEQLRSASVYRWAFAAEIATLESMLADLEVVLSFTDGEESGEPVPDDFLPWLQRLTNELQLPKIDANMDKLPLFPTNVAQPIAALAGHVAGLRNSAIMLLTAHELGAVSFAHAVKMRERMHRMREFIGAIDWKAPAD